MIVGPSVVQPTRICQVCRKRVSADAIIGDQCVTCHQADRNGIKAARQARREQAQLRKFEVTRCARCAGEVHKLDVDVASGLCPKCIAARDGG